MLTKSRITVATALIAVALGASSAPALADWNVQGSPPNDKGALSENRSDSGAITADARGEFSRDPVIPPVVVEVDDPVSGGFDWTAGIIGLAGGVAVAVLAGAAVAGGRRRPFRASAG